MKESFRDNYDQSLFVSNAHVPLSLALGIEYPLSPTTGLMFSFERKNYRLASSDEISLAVMPALAGVQYRFSKEQIDLGGFFPYIGVRAGWYWALFSAKLLVTTQNGPDLVAILDESKSYFGYGALFNVGLDHPLGERTTLGFDVQYDVNTLGSVDDGGLGNLGGFLFGLKFAIAL